MIVSRKYPRSVDELVDVIRQGAEDVNSIAMQAGHFLVYYDHTEDLLLPCVETELRGPRHDAIRNEVGQFPHLTWQLGLSILGILKAEKKRVLVLVNDWQYLPSSIDRALFYRRFSRLPESYLQTLESVNATISLQTPRNEGGVSTGDFFSEQSLRNAYTKHIKRMIKNSSLPDQALISTNGNGENFSCSLTDTLGKKEEIYCSGKRPNCTHEVAFLLREVTRLSGCDCFINIFPIACKGYVEAGTELSSILFPGISSVVINLGLPSSHVHRESDLIAHSDVTIHEFNR